MSVVPPQFLGKDPLDIKIEVIQVFFSLTASPILPCWAQRLVNSRLATNLDRVFE